MSEPLSFFPRAHADASRDLVCWSRSRWSSTCTRTEHLMLRFAQTHRVFFIEEPLHDLEDTARRAAFLEIRREPSGVVVVVPHFGKGQHPDEWPSLLAAFFATHGIGAPIAWYDSPMLLPMTRDLPASVVVYDCMDEPARHATRAWMTLEGQLVARADLVFTRTRTRTDTGTRHEKVRFIDARVDVALEDPQDQAEIPHPRIGCYGVADELMDVDLLARIARLRPHWHIVVLGAVATKVDRAACNNVHLLGIKNTEELPAYLAGWDAAFLASALHGDAGEVIEASEDILRSACGNAHARAHLRAVDDVLAQLSWDYAFSEMRKAIEHARAPRNDDEALAEEHVVSAAHP